MHRIDEIVVIGSGNWGLALATLFSKNCPTRVWTIDRQTCLALQQNRDLPGDFHRYPIPPDVVIEEKYASGFDEETSLIILAVPSSQVQTCAEELAGHARNPLILSVSKGYHVDWMCTMSQVIQRCIPGAIVTVLTGPTIANEVAEGKPTRAVLASNDLVHLALIKKTLANTTVSFEAAPAPEHHEICAALKGLIAIAVGIADGLELGSNIQGLLMTEGIREMAVVASFFGIPQAVAHGVSGAGDLITTCISPDSRNRRLGSLLAQGLSVKDALDAVGMTVEGLAMSRTIETLWSLDVSIPLIHLVNAIATGEHVDLTEKLRELVSSL